MLKILLLRFQSWTPVDTLDECKWIQCINPPSPPAESLIVFAWDGTPIGRIYTSAISVVYTLNI